MKRVAYWDNAKGVLILLVVLGHLLEKLSPTSLADGATVLHDFIYLFHMPAFILISGHFIGRSSRNPMERIPRFLTPLIVVSLLYATVSLIQGDGFGFRLAHPQLGLWYLEFMIVACIVARFVKPHQDKGAVIPLIAVLVSLGVGMDDTIDTGWSMGRIFYFTPFLLMGMCVDVEKVIGVARRHRMCCIMLLIASLLLMGVLEDTDWFERGAVYGANGYEALGYSYPLGILVRLGMYAWSTLAMFCLLALIPRRQSFLTVVGGETMDIYLTHTFLLGAFWQPVTECFSMMPTTVMVLIFTLLITVACPLVIRAHHALRRVRRGRMIDSDGKEPTT